MSQGQNICIGAHRKKTRQECSTCFCAAPQVRTLALGCAADLMKADAAVQAAASSPDFLPTVLDALQARSVGFVLGFPAHRDGRAAGALTSLQLRRPAHCAGCAACASSVLDALQAHLARHAPFCPT